MFYFEVKVISALDVGYRLDTKSHNFAVGLSACDFQGIKLVGETKESIGITGEGKVQLIDDSGKQQSLCTSIGNFEF